MKGKLLAFLIPVVYVFALLLVVSPSGVSAQIAEDWRDSSECVAQCGTTEGTKTQTLFVEVCDEGCPTRSFTADHKLYAEDFVQYGSTWGSWSSCQTGNKCPNTDENAGICEDSGMYCSNGRDQRRYKVIVNNHACPAGYTYKEQSGSADDCYKVETFGPIDVVYGLKSCDPNKCHRPTGVSLGIPSWAMSDFNTDPNLPEHIQDAVETNCRFEASSTTREVACSTDMIACKQDCPTACGYLGGEVADGEGGYEVCPATTACPDDDDEEEEDDDGEVEGVTDEDKGEVKGTTDVVLAETGASDTTLVYFVQMILVLGTLVSSAIFVKKYML